MSLENLKAIADGGVLLVLVFVLWIVWDMGKRFAKVIENHMEHDIESKTKETESRIENTKVLQQLTDTIDKLDKRL